MFVINETLTATSPSGAGAGGPLSPSVTGRETTPTTLVAARHFSSPSRSSAPTPSTRQMTPMSPTYDQLFAAGDADGALTSIFPHPAFADPLKVSAAEGSPIRTAPPHPDSPYPQGLQVFTNYTNPDTYSFTTMPLEGVTPLGEGGSAIVYPGNMVSVSATATKVSQVAIAKLKPGHYNREAFTAIQELPPCPYLLARPIHTYESADDEYVYITMPQLEGPDLCERLIHPLADDVRFQLLVTAFKHTSLGLAHLHKHGFVHRDSRLENMHPDGLFDYGALAKAGEWTHLGGADAESSPPELNLYLSNPSLWHKDTEQKVVFPYNRDFDIFVLGFQAVRGYRQRDPSKWPRTTPREEAFANFVSLMISANPAERPDIEACTAFFTALKHSFDDKDLAMISLAEPPQECLLKEIPVVE